MENEPLFIRGSIECLRDVYGLNEIFAYMGDDISENALRQACIRQDARRQHIVVNRINKSFQTMKRQTTPIQ